MPNKISRDERYHFWDEKYTGWNNGRLDIAEENIGEPEDITMKTNKNKTQGEKRIKKSNTKKISDLWDYLIYM